MKKFIAALLLSLPLSAAASDQGAEYAFKRVGYAEGLSHSAVLSLFQDNTDLVWMGTYDGLNCYDGTSMHTYRSDFQADGALSNNIVSAICQADGDNLWVNTFQSLNRLSKTSGEITRTYSFSSYVNLSSNSRGNTWLISRDTLYYYSTVHEKFVVAQAPFQTDGDPENRFFVSEQGELMYFGGSDGNVTVCSLSIWDADSTATRVKVKVETFHPKPIGQIFYQTGMMCFVDEDNDLYLYDTERKTKVYIRNLTALMEEYGYIAGIVPFYEDFLIGFQVNGLFRLKAFSKYEAEPVDRNIRIFCLYHDIHQGVVWIGSDGQGAVMYAKKYSIARNILFPSLSANLSRPVRAILTDSRGAMWIGTKGDGVVYLPDWEKGTAGCEIITPNGRRSANGYRRESQEFKVFSIKESQYRSGVWMGTGDEGLMYCPQGGVPRKVRFPYASDPVVNVHDIYEKDENTLYISSTGSGIHKLTLDGTRVIHDKKYSFFFEGQEIVSFYSMKAAGDTVLYAGSRGDGLVRLDLKTDEYSVISMRYLYNEAIDDILSLCPARDGSLYVGTVSGLLRLHNSASSLEVEHIGRKNGLVNDMIHGILEDSDGFIWLGTDRGLVKYNPANSLAQTYLFSAGIELGEFSDDAYFKDLRTGKLFLGGNGGLIALEPHTPEMVQYFTHIQLRSLEVAHEAVRMSDYKDKNGNLVFKGSNVSFAVTFAVPDYQAAGFVEYSAFLEGYDKEWSPYTLDNKVSFTDVPAGTYTLRLRYKKDVYDTLPEEFSVKVHIRPGFFRSPFFMVLVVIAFLALLFYCLISYRGIREAREKGTAVALSDEVLKMMADVITKKPGKMMEGLGSLADAISCSSEDDMAFMRKTIEVISENITREDLGTALIADRMAMTPRSFYRKFRSISNITPGALIKIYRLEMASRLLLEEDKQILDVLAEVGISSRSYFYKEFTERFGMTPGAWKSSHGMCGEDECAK